VGKAAAPVGSENHAGGLLQPSRAHRLLVVPLERRQL